MKKLFAYLDKIGVEERPRRGVYNNPPAEYNRLTYGTEYFENAPNHTHEGALVTLDYNVEAPAEYFKNLQDIETRIRKYCKKYGYTADITRHPWEVTIKIEKTEDRENASFFYSFVERSRHECEFLMHKAYKHGIHGADVERALKAIMQKHGEEYNEFLNATRGKATA